MNDLQDLDLQTSFAKDRGYCSLRRASMGLYSSQAPALKSATVRARNCIKSLTWFQTEQWVSAVFGEVRLVAGFDREGAFLSLMYRLVCRGGMFIEGTTSGGQRYAQLVESDRDESGRVKRRTVADLRGVA